MLALNPNKVGKALTEWIKGEGRQVARNRGQLKR